MIPSIDSLQLTFISELSCLFQYELGEYNEQKAEDVMLLEGGGGLVTRHTPSGTKIHVTC